MDATAADSRSAKLLAIHPGSPVLRMRELVYDRTKQAVLYALSLYGSDRHSLVVRRYRKSRM